MEGSRWLIEYLLQAETTDRVMRSVNHQMYTASSRSIAIWPASISMCRLSIAI